MTRSTPHAPLPLHASKHDIDATLMDGVGPLRSSRLCSLLTSDECRSVIDWLERAGFERTGLEYPANYRDNDRAVLDDPALASALFERAVRWLPETLVDGADSWVLRGLNTRFRACRYRGGQSFCVHRDGPWTRSSTERSLLTLQVYLNGAESFEGGRTRFYADRTAQTLVHAAVAHPGDAIVFDHRAWHDGEAVSAGTKYVLRTDVLYERSERVLDERERRHDGYAWAVIAADGVLVSCGRDGRVKVWGDPRREYDLADGSVTALTALADGTIVAGTRAGNVFFLRGGRVGRRVSLGAAVLALATDGRRVFAGLSDASIATVNDDGVQRDQAHAVGAWVWSVAWSPAGLGTVGSDGALMVNGRELARWSAPLTALAWCDRRWIVGDARGSVHDGERSFVAHEGAVTSIAALGAGVFATTGEDGALRVHEREAIRCEHRAADFARSATRTRRGVAWCGYDGVVRESALNGDDALSE